MKRKNHFDKVAEKLAAKKVNRLNGDEESKDKQEEDAKDKDDKSKTDGETSGDTKGDSKDKPKDDSTGKSDDKQDGDSDAKGTQPDAKDAKDAKDGGGDKSEPDKQPATQPAPATRNYTGAGDISGVKDLRQEVVINGDVTVKQFGGAPLAVPPVGAKLDAFVEAISKINFTNDEENGFRDGSILYEVKRAKEEGEVPGAAVKFADLVYLKCPEKLAKLVRNHISEIIESDPEVIQYIKEVDARKHQIERRFRPFRAEVSHELWDEATARAYITEQKADLPPRLAENARDEDFGTWVLVELNADTGAIRELSAEEAKAHAAKQAPAEPKKKPRSKKTEDKGEAV